MIGVCEDREKRRNLQQAITTRDFSRA